MKYLFLSVVIFFLQTNSVLSRVHGENKDSLSDIFITIPVSEAEDVNRLIQMGLQIELNIMRHGMVKGFVSKSNLTRIMNWGFDVSIVNDFDRNDSMTKNMRSTDQKRKPWYTFKQYHDILEEWASKYPHIATFDTAGFSIQKRPVYQMKISGSPDTAARQRIYFNGACHGNEKIGPETLMKIMKYLLEGYATDEKIKKIVDRTDFVFHPIQNVDGFNNGSKGKRQLSNGRDPNRAFGYKMNGAGTDRSLPYQWPEMKVYLHGMIEAPWYFNFDYHCGITTMYSAGGFGADREAYKRIKEVYPLGNENGESLYQFGNREGGYAYDAAYGKCGSMAFLPELCPHYPAESKIEEITEYNLDCIKDVLDEIQKGVSGRITNAKTGAPVYARVKIKNKGSHVFSDPRSGAFFKYIPQPKGELEVTVFANGFKPETKTVKTNPGAFAHVDFKLTPDETLVYGALSLDVIGIGNKISTEETRNCLEIHDTKGTTIKDGFIIVDFGPKYLISNTEGDDFTVYMTNNDTYTLSVHNDIDAIIDKKGIKLGDGSGTKSFDLQSINLDSARWVRIDAVTGSPSIDAIEAKPRDFITDKKHSNTINPVPVSPKILSTSGGFVVQMYLEKGHYSLNLYNMIGKKISILKKEIIRIAGMQSIQLPKQQGKGLNISHGVYLLQIEHKDGNKVLQSPVFW